MCIYDGESSTVWDPVTRKARKQHMCDECGGRIEPGERYQSIGSLYDGEWTRFAICDCCDVLWLILHMFECGGQGMAMLVGGLDEEITNHLPFGGREDDEPITVPHILRDAYDENRAARTVQP